MENLPKISIITPTLNSEKVIESCLKSVAEQTYEKKEHLIIDGQSRDKTLEIVKKYVAKYPHIKWISEKDGGIYDAMNKGINLSSGQRLYFLGSDDVLFSDRTLMDIFSQKNLRDYDVIYGNAKFKISGAIYDGKFNSYKLLRKNICHQAIFFKREIFSKFGKFEVKYKGVADWVINMQWFNNNSVKYKYIDTVIAIYNEDGYCFNNPDVNFSHDYEFLLEKYFSALTFYFFKKRKRAFIKKMIKLIYGYQEQN
jgi:glycosyltransferase involved in cell wall biosynthesis